MKSINQDEHVKINEREYPGTRQLCELCDEPTGRCEDDSIICEYCEKVICEDCLACSGSLEKTVCINCYQGEKINEENGGVK